MKCTLDATHAASRTCASLPQAYRRRRPSAELLLHLAISDGVLSQGVSEEFIDLTRTLYTGLHARLKVNGHVGHAFSISNGLRQGAPSSCPYFLLVQEVFIRDLQADKSFEGVQIPGPGGVGTEELRVRAYADDTKLFLRSLRDAEGLQRAVRRWEAASGQIISAEKTIIVLLGEELTTRVPRGVAYKRLVRYGIDDGDKSIGIVPGTPTQVGKQWREMLRNIQQMAADATAGRRLAGNASTLAQCALVGQKGA